MVSKIWILLVVLLMGGTAAFSQCSFRLAGHVVDADTRDRLPGATVTIKETGASTVTDSNGDFAFDSLCQASYTIVISHIHCETVITSVQLNRNKHLDIAMPHFRNTLGEVTVTALKPDNQPGYKETLKGSRLEETLGFSFAEALAKLNGVTLLRTGSNIAKPVIHGLHSNRILTINNGVRQEGQQWGNEHAPEIDPFLADNMEVIKGVDELKYGSDAVGGVVLINPKALRYTPGMYGELNAGYFTNNGQYVASGMFEQQLKKSPAFSYRLQGTFRKGANINTPDYRLNNTALEEKNYSLSAGWKKEDYKIEAFYSHFETQVGIFTGSHIGNTTDLLSAIAAGKPDPVFLDEKSYEIGRPYQNVRHRLFKLKSDFQKGDHRFHVQFAAQHNYREEYDLVRSSTIATPQMKLGILTLTEDVSWEHPAFRNFKGSLGISGIQQDNWYGGGSYLIPEFQLSGFGGYWIEKWQKHKWEISGGLRLDQRNLKTARYLISDEILRYRLDFTTPAASLGTVYQPGNGWRLNALASLASRSPHVNELLSDGVHHGSARYEIGNPSIQPEKALNLSAGASYRNPSGDFQTELTIYHNRINDFIYQQPRPDSPVVTLRGAFPRFDYQQIDAMLNGMDLAMSYELNEHWELQAKASLLRAKNREVDDWLINMPSDRYSAAVTYRFEDTKRFSDAYISFELPFVTEQTRVPDEARNGIQDYMPPPEAYTLLNMNAAFSTPVFGKQVSFSAGASNITDTRYRDYLNAFRYFHDETGRNFWIRIKVPFGT